MIQPYRDISIKHGVPYYTGDHHRVLGHNQTGLNGIHRTRFKHNYNVVRDKWGVLIMINAATSQLDCMHSGRLLSEACQTWVRGSHRAAED